MTTPTDTGRSSSRAKDGSPEPFVRLFGEELASLRSQRGLSRTRLANLLHPLLPMDGTYKSCGESFIKRLENGKVVKITRVLVDALCQALKCTPQERIRLLLYADRNVLGDGSAPTDVHELFAVVMLQTYRSVEELILGSLHDRVRPGQLTLRDMEELVFTAHQLIRETRSGLSTHQ